VCPSCGRSNQSHFKFCLGCGAELTAKDVAPVKAQPGQSEARTMMADAESGSAPARPGTAPPVFSDMGPAQDPVTDPAIPALLDTANASAPIPDVGTDPSAHNGGSASPSSAADDVHRLCMSCGTVVAPGFRFCPGCGADMSNAPPVARGATGQRTAIPAPSGKTIAGRLVLIRPDGTEGGSHGLVEGENAIGRAIGGMFEADGYLSPMHAELVLNAAGLVVRDSGSLNGVFVRIHEEEELLDGDVLRIGQELLRFDAIPTPMPLEDGTEVLGSPNPGFWGRLSVVVARDQEGSAFPLLGDAVILGRERGDFMFPEDGYVSGQHARLSLRDGRYWLADLNSSNGTFIKVRGERLVQSGGYVLMGQQLFRVAY